MISVWAKAHPGKGHRDIRISIAIGFIPGGFIQQVEAKIHALVGHGFGRYPGRGKQVRVLVSPNGRQAVVPFDRSGKGRIERHGMDIVLRKMRVDLPIGHPAS